MATTRKQIGYGSQGDEVKELQTLLNKNGAKLTVDGIYGKNTQDAVRKYQKENGLSIDGVTGSNTWSSLLGGGTSSTGSANKTNPYTGVDSTKYGGGFKQSDKVTDAYDRASAAEKAWQDYINSGFTYGREEDYNSIFDKILNREDFKFDLNGDALYKQYKDKYITQGKMAMQDTMGQAAAMTGGYGNSYAASVGNQAYQQSLQQLNDVVPELYQMAYDRYAQEGQDLYNEYSLLSADRNAQYGEWADKGNQLLTDRGYYADRADTEYSKEYGEYRNDVADEQWQKTFDYGKERDKASDAENERSFAYGQAMNSIQAGIMPSDDVLAAAGMTKEEAQSLANAYKNSGTGEGKSNLTVQEWTNITNNAKNIIETAKLNKVADGGEMELLTYLDELLRGGLISEEGLLSIMELYFPSAKVGEGLNSNFGIIDSPKPSVKPILTLK